MLHFNRLNRTWRNAEPTIVGPIKKLNADRAMDSLAQIPGTKYVIMHSIPKARLSVWSTENGKRMCSISAPQRVLDISTGWTEQGRFTIALITNPERNAFHSSDLHVLTVDYNDSTVTMAISYSRHFEVDLTRVHWATFLNAEVTGVLYFDINEADHTPSPLHVLAFNRIDCKETDICALMGLPLEEARAIIQDGQSGTSFWNDNLYIHFEYQHSSYQRWVPRSSLPYSDNLDITARATLPLVPNIPPLERPPNLHRADFTFDEVNLEAILTTKSDFGVLSLTIYTAFDTENGLPATVIDYWIVDGDSFETGHGSDLPTPSLYPHVIIPGRIKPSALSTWLLCHSTNSGTYIILLVDVEEETKLRMVHLEPASLHFSVHAIEVPSSIKLHLVNGFFVDEHCGTVTLYQAKGKMFVLRFA
ncbi:hypothetical protein AX17_004566 [Amanita inopinata Kibby_2008]|nr:hypothetical protein AX17_004566 [Amanita inopinata Kibby_2008]